MWQSNGAALEEQCAIDGRSDASCRLSVKLWQDFGNVRLFWIAMVCVLYMISNYFRAARWRDMLQGIGSEVSLFNAFAAVMIGYFANLGVPRSGEILRPTMLARYEDIGIDKAFGTIVLERIVDVLLFASVIGLGFFFHYELLVGFLSQNLSLDIDIISIVGIVMILLAITGIFFIKWILSAQTESQVLSKIQSLVRGFIQGLGSIRKLPNLPLFIFQSLMIWFLYFLMHYVAFFAFAPTELLGLKDALLVFDFGSLGVVIPSPGGMGTYHYLVEESLSLLGIDRLDGFSFAMIIFFTINIGCNAIFGLLSLLALPIVNKK